MTVKSETLHISDLIVLTLETDIGCDWPNQEVVRSDIKSQ